MTTKTKEKPKKPPTPVPGNDAKVDAPTLDEIMEPETSDPPVSDNGDPLVQGTTDERTEARDRAAQCERDLVEVLRKHNCVIQPYLMPPEPVGRDQRTIQVSAAYGIAPLPNR